MSTISDVDMSESSRSPASYTTLESPLSSPPQEVPELFSTLRVCRDKNMYKPIENDSGHVPFLKIIEQPQQHFRFRYNTEKSGSTHGSILGRSYIENKSKIKTHPAVELLNYSGKAVIKCSVKYDQAVDKNIHKNVYKILEAEQKTKSFTVPKDNKYKVGFPGIGIHTIKKTDLVTLLYNKLSEVAKNNTSVNTTQLRAHCEDMAKIINQNVVRLQFTAHDSDGKEICAPVLSEPILNKKCSATNALNICRMSMYIGKPSGGEDLFLLIDKVDKNDIKVRFFEKDASGREVWSAYAEFSPSDVHHQCAIVCRTPAYEDPKTSTDVKVWIELVRTSHGTSEPKEFIYKADYFHKMIKRRKVPTRRNENFNTEPKQDSHFTGGVLNFEQPVMVLQNEAIGLDAVNTASQQDLQPTESEWTIISSSVDILQNPNASAQSIEAVPFAQTFDVSMLSGQSLDGSMPSGQVFVQPMLPSQALNEAMQSEQALNGPMQSMPVLDGTVLSGPAFNSPILSGQTSNEAMLSGQLENQAMLSGQALPCPMWGQGVGIAPSYQAEFESSLLTPPASAVSEPEDNISVDLDDDTLKEYFRTFDFDDLNKADLENDNGLVFDSGRTKVEETTSEARPGPAASEVDDDALFQVACDHTVADAAWSAGVEPQGPDTGAGTVEPQSCTDGIVVRLDGDNASNIANIIRATDATQNEEASEDGDSADGGADVDYPASFTKRDAAAVKELVRELCEMLRDKRRADAAAVRARLDALFDIRLSNGDTFLHMTLFKNKPSFEALVKVIHSVKMPHLLNYGNDRGETILHLAVVHGSPELVATLAARGCSLEARTADEETALHYAVRYAGAGTLRALLGAGAAPDAANAERQSALHLCALHGRAQCAALLGARGADAGARDAAGRTALHLCALDARARVLRALLPHARAHVDAPDAAGRTALALAAARAPAPAAAAAARALLAAGADAARAWPHAAAAPARDLLRPHLPPHVLAEPLAVKAEPDDDDDDDDDAYENTLVSPRQRVCLLSSEGWRSQTSHKLQRNSILYSAPAAPARAAWRLLHQYVKFC